MESGSARCLIVTNNFPPVVGGAGNVYAALAAAAGGRIVVLAAATDYRSGQPVPGLAEHDATADYPLERIAEVRPRLHRKPGPWVRLHGMLLEEPRIRRRLWQRVQALVQQHGIRVLCLADEETVGWMIAPAQRRGLKVILYSHGDDLGWWPGASAARMDARRRRYFAQADAIVMVSESGAEDLGQRFGVPRGRITLVPNGVDLSCFGPEGPESGLLGRYGLAGRRVVVTVARLVPRKGIDRLIRALPAVAAAVPDLMHLVVGDGECRGALEAQARDLGLADRVVFAGQVPEAELAAHFRLGEVFAMTNRRTEDGEDEGFGLVFLEAMACGVPVLGGRAGGVPEVVTEGETGLLVEADDTPAVAAALIRLLTDAPLRARLRAAGLQAAAAASWPRRAARFLALCEALAHGVPHGALPPAALHASTPAPPPSARRASG